MSDQPEPRLVIFDCDGVLVDSEPISLSVMREVLAEQGCVVSESDGYDKLLGRSVTTIARQLRDDTGLDLTDAHLEQMRERLFDRFASELQPIAGIASALQEIDTPICVASSSQPERIAFSLAKTALAQPFGDNIFSATMVRRGKPAPDLFLYAAKQMGARPEQCVVIEDSPAGVEAAKAAGMSVIAFVGGSHAKAAGLREKVGALSPDRVIENMSDLVATLRGM